MSHIFIIIWDISIEILQKKSDEDNEDIYLWVRNFDLIESRNSLSQYAIVYNSLYISTMEKNLPTLGIVMC